MRSSTVTRLLKKAGILDESSHGFDTYFVRDGRLFGQNVSSHPWKSREYTAHDLCACSLEEESLFLRLSDIERKAELSKIDEAKTEAADREAWIQSLPAKVDGLFVNKVQGTLEDEYGNYYLTLPNPVDDLAAWIANNSYDPE